MALDAAVTKDGYEVQFATNHIGHALLIKLLLPMMLRTAELPDSDVRIINMASTAYKTAPSEGIAFGSLKTNQDGLRGMIGGKWTRYGQSKLANILYARELAKRYPSIKTVSVHPGYIKTDIFSGVSFLTALPVRLGVMLGSAWTPVEEGPYNQTWAGTTARENLEDGAYYVPIAKKGSLDTKQARDDALAEKLWDWTQKELEAFS
ncbi:hypothetical protein LTR64_008130 [Lithohypha guttulata]|uniref:uncharacterized protein n=1 Tax=Lithohypha guttulata TaxID=1690604 RepID=UPI002DDE9D8D|nr:hypothetical protein LTR51_007999 [Lithohypha guttulata]